MQIETKFDLDEIVYVVQKNSYDILDSRVREIRVRLDSQKCLLIEYDIGIQKWFEEKDVFNTKPEALEAIISRVKKRNK